MTSLEKCLKSIRAKTQKQAKKISMSEIPEPLKEFYSQFGSMSTSFGDILDYETALVISQSPPFNPNWFVFGKDKYFNFWLCSNVDYGTNLYFTYWDHGAGTEIEEPVWKDLPSFLLAMKEESKNF